MSKKLLFVCSYGQVRSPTAVKMYGGRYIGISDRYMEDKFREYCEWADIIYVFSETHVWFIEKYYPKFNSKVSNLNINDIYGKDCPELRKRIKKRMDKYEVNINE